MERVNGPSTAKWIRWRWGIKNRNIMIIAGEASGDHHGAHLVKEISKLCPGCKFFGMGGDMMMAEGVNVTHHVREMAIVGIFEVINKLPLIRKAMKDMEGLMDVIRPDCIILIDYPDFNLRLAKKARERGIKVIYYISPQVWAWRKGRVKTISKVVDKMMVVFPFEVPIYKDAGVDVEFVGHPIMDMVPWEQDKDSARSGLGFGGDDRIIGLLPGSRRREIEFLLPEMLKAAEMISSKIKGVRYAIPVASTLDPDYINGFVKKAAVDVSIFRGRAYDVMSASELLLISSGTATLEAAVVGTPMVITYRMLPLTYFIGRKLVSLELGGLPNIVAGKGIVPELIQDNATSEKMALDALMLLNDEAALERMRSDLLKVREALGGAGASRRAAEIVYNTISKTTKE